MTPSLKQLIREEAEKKYPNPFKDVALWKEGYIAGAEAMAEKMEGLAEWIDSGPYYLKYENVWCSIHDHELSITTSELLTKYFDHLKEKEGK